MQRPRRPFDIALLALFLAIGLPSVVFMFGAIRTRQLQSKANPRWAQFAKVTGPSASSEVSNNDSNRILVRTASIRTEDHSDVAPIARQMPEPNLTGSVTGHISIEVPVHSEQRSSSEAERGEPPVQSEVVNRTPIIFRPLEDEIEPGSRIAQSANHLESQLAQVRQRLDQLTRQQQQHQADDIHRESQFLDALEKLRETVKPEVQTHETRSDETRPNTSSTSSANESPSNENPPEESPVDEPFPPEPKAQALPITPAEEGRRPAPVQESVTVPSKPVPELQSSVATPPSVDIAPYDDSIHIRREVGPDHSDVFTIEARDADIRQFFVRLSEAARVSILPGPDVNGQISLNLHSVHFETALKAILKSRRYVFEREGDIVIISTADEAARLKHLDRKLFVRLYQPSYLSAAELNRLIEPLLSADGRHSFSKPSRSGLSQTDELDRADEITQREAVIVQDVAEVLGQIDQILVDMDIPPLQVNIEAKILCVRLSGRMEHGVDLGLLPCQRDSGTSFAEGGLKHASLSCNVPTFIKSIERLADTSIVTSQHIQVLNKHRAEMLIGDRIGYQSKPGDNIRFLESGTRLIFRPSISADGNIRLEIQPERSSVTVSKRTKLAQQNTTELTTQVLVHDGATVAIGGLIAEQAIETTSHVPLISSIPVVGVPFRHRNERLQRTELIVLVTPHIVTDCATETDGASLQQAAEERAIEFRNQQSEKSRFSLAKAHYNRASCYLQQGNPVKARQQIEASLRLNKADLDALRLRNEINQCFVHAMGQ